MTDRSTIRIGERLIGRRHPCFVIGEVAMAHDGSLGTAHAFIDVVARSGADAVKFQTHIADAESTPREPWRVQFSPRDETRYEYWKRLEFSEREWGGLRRHAEDVGLVFLSSPFSLEAVELLERIGMPAWKIASGEMTHPVLLRRLANGDGRPVLLSTGMVTEAELDAAVALLVERDTPFAVLQCTTAYPCPLERIGLNVLDEYRDRRRCPVGLSDHSGTIWPGLAAAARGADLIEVHVTLSRDAFGPDVPASLTPDELARLVEGVRAADTMLAHPVEKPADAAAIDAETATLRRTFGKSIFAAIALPAGTVLRVEQLDVKKPVVGVSASRIDEVSGRTIARSLDAGDPIRQEDLR